MQSSRVSSAVLHGLKVGAHILVAIIIIGAWNYVSNNQAFFTAYLVSLGLPVAIVNVVIASVLHFLQSNQPTDDISQGN